MVRCRQAQRGGRWGCGVHTVRRLTRLNDENGQNWAIGAFVAAPVIGSSMSAPGRASSTCSTLPTWCVLWCGGACVTNWVCAISRKCFWSVANLYARSRPGEGNTAGPSIEWEVTQARARKNWAQLVCRRDLHQRKRALDLSLPGDWSWRKLVDVFLSETRDKAAAEALFRSARTVTGSVPERVTTDGHDAYPGASKAELGEAVRHRTNRYLNNHLEQDPRGIKQRIRPMGVFKSVESARRFCRVHDEVRNFLRPRSRRNERIPLAHRRLFYSARTCVLLNSLAAA